MAVHGAMISSLPRGCHRAGTCPGSGGRPFPVGRRRLREHVAHEMHHAPPVAFDYRGLEQGALEFRHLQLESAGLGGELAFVVAGPVRLPLPGALVLGGVGDLVGLKRRVSR